MMRPTMRGGRALRLFVTTQVVVLLGSMVASTPAAVLAAGTGALDLGSAGSYVTFGDPAKLDLAQFTVETWFKRTGTGVASTTGNGGIVNFVPLLTHGAAEADSSAVDANWLLGINTTGNVIAADFEGIDDPAPIGGNAPISGTTTITDNVWHHAAATFDGTTFAVYLDGVLQASATPGFHPRSDSTQGVALGAMIMSNGTATAGRFAGMLDEARVWSVARTGPEIVATKDSELTSGTGLVARWGLDEPSGTLVTDSIATAANGTITGTGYARASGFNANNAPVAVADAYSTPQSTAKVVAAPGVLANDTDTEANPLTAILVTDVSHGTLAVAANGGFTYTPTAGYNGPDSFTYKANDATSDSNTVTVSLAVGNVALDLGSAGSYVTFGDPAKLDLAQFTVETWFKRTGTGVASTTGNGGIVNFVPLLTHGAAEADSSAVDANWLLGINTTGNVIAADFEGIDDPAPIGGNAPISGTTTITDNVWHHAAATFDGTTFAVYLDGVLQASATPGFHPRSDSTQGVALGAMIMSNGTATAGRFAGMLDEARVWSVARTGPEIVATKDSELTSGTGLVARWGLDEPSGTLVTDSIATAANGTITGTGYARASGFVPPAAGNSAPAAPTLNAPANAGTGVGTSPTLDVGVSDPDGGVLTVTYFGRPNASGNFAQIAQHAGVASGTSDTASWASLGAGQTFQWYVTVSDGTATTTGPTWTFHTVASTDPVFVGAGDIADCERTQDEATGAVLGAIGGAVWTAGDNVYPSGSVAANWACYEASWGDAIKARTRPVPGNHDWGTGQGGAENLVAYNTYFGSAATDAGGKSYYSYDIPSSNWHIVNLDTECQLVPGGCAAGSPQELWLRADLTANSTKNVIAVWHKPRYSSGVTNYQTLQPMFDDLYEFGVDILLQGHDHIYERFAPLKSGATLGSQPVADPTYGIRQFTVGTGGAALQSCPGTLFATSQACNASTYGVMKLTLHASTYDWQFLPIAGSTFTDSGTGSVHAAPPAANAAPVAVADTYTTPFNTAKVVAAPGILGNDSDANSDPLTAVLVTNVTHGVLSLAANGGFTYTPTSGYSGADSFTYKANDGALDSNAVTVSLTVGGNAAPAAPTLNAPADASAGVGTSPTLDVGVSDSDGGLLTVTYFGRPYASGNFVQIAQHAGVASGTNDTASWASLGAGQRFEWYVTVSDGTATTTGATWTFDTVASTDPVFVGVGDIASCGVATDTATGNVIAGIAGTIFTTGDNVYPNGTAADFATCYAPTPWGSPAVLSRTHPVPGNHDWGTGVTDSLAGYLGYYGANATDAGGKSYYSYDIPASNWHVVNLDSECAQVVGGGCAAGSAQELWLKADLSANSSKNVIALWHKPRYSSGATNLQALQPLWDALYAAGADILLDGHDHIYERFDPMKSGATLADPPVADATYGIHQFTVGMGGEAHHSLGTTLATSQVRNNTDFGIFKLTLHATTYDWVFLPIAGSTFTDSGTGTVHSAPPAPSHTLSGTVTAAGSGVEGAIVYVFDAATAAYVANAFTDATGAYSVALPAGAYNLWVQTNTQGYPDQAYGGDGSFENATDVDLTAGSQTADVALVGAAAAATISGTVTAAGSGVEGAIVYVFDAATAAYVANAFTDATGAYSVALPAGTYNLWVQTNTQGYPDQAYGGDGSFENATDVDLTAGSQTADVALVGAAAAATISGTVTAAGSGVEGAIVYVFDAATAAYVANAFTDATGAYSVALPAGTYNLWVQTNTQGYPDQAYGGDGSFENATDVDLTAGSQTADVALVGAAAAATISGTVTAAGSGVEGAIVYVFDAATAAYVANAFTDATGAYSVALPAGTYNLWVQTNTQGYPDQAYGGDGSFENATDVDLTAGSQTADLALVGGP